MKLKLAIVASVLVTMGCTIGNGHICGPQTPAAYCDREAYERLVHPKPYIEEWEKPSATPEVRGQDSESCGGGDSNHAPLFTRAEIKAEQRSGESEAAARSRLHKSWQRCMLKKGYRFTGKCYDNEISRASPACGAP